MANIYNNAMFAAQLTTRQITGKLDMIAMSYHWHDL